MTEAEWLTASDPTPLLKFLRDNVSDRKLRLWACACALQQNGRFGGISQAVAVAEQWADGTRVAIPQYLSLTYVCQESAWVAAYEGTALFLKSLLDRDLPEAAEYRPALRYQLLTFHCIFGNPFRPVEFSLAWRSETAVALATGIYTERAFDRMPILADALEEAGCDHPDVLAHCRGPGPHARGCWVVDLVLGKS